MNKITQYPIALAVFAVVALSTAKTAVVERWDKMDRDRGDVPGWAIAAGATCVLAAVVYAAFSAVINKWVAKIK